MKKSVVRKQIRDILDTFEIDRIAAKSALIAQHVFRTLWWQEAETVLAFCSVKGEVVTDDIIETALHAGKTVGVPRMTGVELVFYQIQGMSAEFIVNDYGIREPDPSWPVLEPTRHPHTNLLILLPGLAFDRRKNRLGKGKGFYDRFLSRIRAESDMKAAAIGMCFTEQLLDVVPVAAHDQTLDGLITENAIIS